MAVQYLALLSNTEKGFQGSISDTNLRVTSPAGKYSDAYGNRATEILSRRAVLLCTTYLSLVAPIVLPSLSAPNSPKSKEETAGEQQ